MRIGIDAKWLFEGPPSGKVVVQNLVRQLVSQRLGDQLFLIIDRKYRKAEYPVDIGNATVVTAWAGNNFLSNLFVLPLLARRLELDVILFQNFVPFWRCCTRIGYIHDVLFLSHPQFYTVWERLYFAPLRILSRGAERLCTVSHEEKERLIRNGFSKDPENIDVIPHGVSEEFVPSDRYSEDELNAVRTAYSLPDKYILFVGRLNIRKNVRNLLVAFSQIKDRYMPLVIVGGKDWKSFDAEAFARQLSIGGRVIFTGPIFGHDLCVVYSLASIFCFPSLAESFGLPALEAMACGIPVVVSSTTSLPEICGNAGNYVNPENPDDIAGMIDRLLGDSAFRRSRGDAALLQARKFSWRDSSVLLYRSINSATGNQYHD